MVNIKFVKKRIELEPIAIFRYTSLGILAILMLLIFSVGLVGEGSQQFSLLAGAFNHGQTNFLHSIGGLGQDPVLYHGKVFWDEGAFPAVILMPFVALFNLSHHLFYQGYIKWAFMLGTFYFIYKIARKFKYSNEDSAYLIAAFALASVYMGVASVSSGWLYAQVVNTFLMFWAFYEFFAGKKRYWLIGVLCAAVMLSRITATPMVLFFALYILYKESDNQLKIKRLVRLVIPLVVAAVLIGLYNYQRFGDPLNNGNQYQLLSSSSSMARSMGLFSLSHIPTNLFTAVLRGPDIRLISNSSWSLKAPYLSNNSLGMSLFITSPYLIYLFTKKWSTYSSEAKYLLVATFFSALIVLSYFGDGANQFGYRYALDFFPELFIVFMLVYKRNTVKMTTGMKTLITLSAIFNFALVATYIN
jgi:hypothetical protein